MTQELLFKYQNNSLFHSIADSFARIVREHKVSVAELHEALDMAEAVLESEARAAEVEAIYKNVYESMKLALTGYVGKVLDEKTLAEIEATVTDAATNNLFEGGDDDTRGQE